MSRIICAAMLALTLAFTGICPIALAADERGPIVRKGPIIPAGAGAGMPPKMNFAMISGTVMKINTADPANSSLEVKSDADGKTYVVGIMPWTNVTKVTDLSELKVGEPVRVMSRKVDDKDVAMGVMFGKIKLIPRPQQPMERKIAIPAVPKTAERKEALPEAPKISEEDTGGM